MARVKIHFHYFELLLHILEMWVRQITGGESEGVPSVVGELAIHDGERVVKHSFFILMAEMLDNALANLVG